ncbi:cytochrome P450 4B1-like isoform X2 [Syngnathus typhle]|uniref:cytochrome P450 4B1-like isoform X2 n=1 Tax=Syngnathus typhle TaxID=161592 RepID=UPI002A69CFE4|nr:cytochrome P450 4B1-like isoform X2 [Syngnathus typhle]
MSLSESLGGLLPYCSLLHSLVLICLVAVVYKLAVLLIQRRDALRNFEAFTGPPGNWFFGHVLQFKQDGTDLDKMVKWGEQYPYAFPLWFGPCVCFINIHHPDYVKSIVTSTGDGLLVSDGQKWFRHRRLLTPGFHYDVLKSYTKLMLESVQIMLVKWEQYVSSGEPFELFEHVSLMTLDTIMKCAFSYDSKCQTESRTNEYIKSVYELTDLVNLRFRTFPYHNDLIFYLSPHGFRHRRACKVAHSHTEEVIRKRKKALEKEKDSERVQGRRTLDFLDILLLARDENQQGLSDEDIRAEVDTFMFEGHDTTASAISFILHTLACHPKHQNKCRQEITRVLDGKDALQWEDLTKMPYTTMCIKESMRLFPPVPDIGRKLTKAITFVDGRTIPAGSLIGISVYALHRNPTVWENPNVFNPLRFLPENVSKRSPHAFVPFSAGPRNCIGQNFAMNEMKVAVASVLRTYQLIEDPARKPEIIPQIVLRSLNGIHIRIRALDA